MARRRDELEALADEVEHKLFKVVVEPVVADVTTEQCRLAVCEAVSAALCAKDRGGCARAAPGPAPPLPTAHWSADLPNTTVPTWLYAGPIKQPAPHPHTYAGQWRQPRPCTCNA